MVLFAVLAAFAPDAPFNVRDKATHVLARPTLPTSYADALARFDRSGENEDGFGDRLHLYVSDCHGECPTAEVIIDRARYGNDDIVRYRVVAWNEQGDVPWKVAEAYRAYAYATHMLKARRFETMPREGRYIIDDSHTYLSHTIDAQTKEIVWSMFSGIRDGSEPEGTFERERAVTEDIADLRTFILHQVPWSREERELLGGLLEVR